MVRLSQTRPIPRSPDGDKNIHKRESLDEIGGDVDIEGPEILAQNHLINELVRCSPKDKVVLHLHHHNHQYHIQIGIIIN